MPSRSESTATAFAPKSSPRILDRRTRRPSSDNGVPVMRRDVREPFVSVNPTCGLAMARRLTTSLIAMLSERSDLRNFRRAGVAKNKSRTSTRVPCRPKRGAGRGSCFAPPSTRNSHALSSASVCEVRDSRATEPIDGSASPRNPMVPIFSKSESSASFDVA